jgi:hypothetical protein
MSFSSLPKKDERTERLRQEIGCLAPNAIEDRRAEAGLTTLSFSSAVHPERHVWLDTDLGRLLVIDLEDWTFEGTWDNAVAHLGAADETVPVIVRAWLEGGSVEECVRLGGWLFPGLA